MNVFQVTSQQVHSNRPTGGVIARSVEGSKSVDAVCGKINARVSPDPASYASTGKRPGAIAASQKVGIRHKPNGIRCDPTVFDPQNHTIGSAISLR